MMANYIIPISEEIFAAWLDGTLSQEEESAFLNLCATNTDMQEILDANDEVDEDYECMVEDGYDLPYEFTTDFAIPQMTLYNDEEELSSYGDAESYDQDDAYDNEETVCQDDASLGCNDYVETNPIEGTDMEELGLI